MPLELACYCPGDETISLCGIVSLHWIGFFQNETTFCELRLIGPSTHEISSNGSFDVNLTPVDDWVEAFPDIQVQAEHNRTLLQFDNPESCGASWYMEARYECYRDAELVAEHSEYANNIVGDRCECFVGGVRRSFFSVYSGGANGTIFHSTPLGDCNGCGATGGLFDPQFNLANTIDPDTSGPLCLCATGGTEPYVFYVIGSLPSGQTLNPTTGCVEGEPDGVFAGSEELVFGVYDADFTDAEVTCNIRRGCPACPEGGGEAAVIY